MFYMSRTNPTGAKEGASFGMSLIPYAGDAKDIQEAVTGKDLITGKKLTGETAKVKNPTHSEVTGLQRRVINKKQIVVMEGIC